MESGDRINENGVKQNWVKRHRMLLTFLFGVAIGIVGSMLGPRMVRPYVPDAIREETELLHGVVRTKRFEGDRLRLTVPTARGTILATFTDDVSEIDLLVLEGDSIALRLPEYEPFVENPEIARVVTVRPSESKDAAGASRGESGTEAAEAEPELEAEPDSVG